MCQSLQLQTDVKKYQTNAHISPFPLIISPGVRSSLSFVCIPSLLPEICFLSQVIFLLFNTMLTRFSVPSLHHPICGWVC